MKEIDAEIQEREVCTVEEAKGELLTELVILQGEFRQIGEAANGGG